MRSPLIVAFGAVLCAGCVDGDYNRYRVHRPPLVEAVDALRPGETGLQDALDSLGAPVFVVEVGLGMALAWGWQDTTNWNVDVSVPVGDAQANFRYTRTSARTRGLVLFFDAAWTLTSVREGYLVDLIPTRQRPRDVDDDLERGP